MKRLGVREFRDHATRYLAGDEVIAVERHGQPIGFYVPTGKSRRESFEEALIQFEAIVQSVLHETGMTEDQLAQIFDVNAPFPDSPTGEDSSVPHASGRRR